jgi:hypothetical protein
LAYKLDERVVVVDEAIDPLEEGVEINAVALDLEVGKGWLDVWNAGHVLPPIAHLLLSDSTAFEIDVKGHS